MSIVACAVTGHRPNRFSFKSEESSLCKKIKSSVSVLISFMYSRGVRRFYIGGALGADMWAGEEIIHMRRQKDYADIQLFCALPFPNYEDEWSNKNKERLEKIKEQSDEIIFISQEKSISGYKKRNYYMIDNSKYLIAIYNPDKKFRSGSGQTVNYAIKKGHYIYYVYPSSAQITPSVIG